MEKKIEPEIEDLAAEMLFRNKARESFPDFMSYLFGTPPPRHMRFLCDKLQEKMNRKGDRLLVCFPPGHGKALALDTSIATPSGWTTMGRLKVGDFVFDETGTPTKVVGVSPVWKDRPVYLVKTRDGESIVADAEHEWSVRLDRKYKHWSIRTSKWIADRTAKRTNPNDQRRPMVTLAGALKLERKNFSVDPYVLGAWLGDGTSAGSRFTSADQEIIDRIVGAEGNFKFFGNKGNAISFRVGPSKREGCSNEETLAGRLRLLGVLNNKHIPEQYMFGSYEQRLSLLQGLIDTDGHVHTHGQVNFSNTNKRLAKDVMNLVFTLGVKASMSETPARLYGKDCGTHYRVSFYMKDSAFLKRKAERTKDGKKYNNRYIRAEYAGIADTVCIEVESKSHLFLAGKTLLPTHNSTVSSYFFPAFYLSLNPTHNIIMVSHTESFAEQWGRKVRNLMMSDEYKLLFPHVVISDDSRSAGRWDLKNGGSYYATGVGGTVTGRRADMVVCDDLLKGIDDAESKTVRDNMWDWWGSDLSTRLKPAGVMVIIGTRWHLDDIIGRVIAAEKQKGGDKWDKVVLPALAKEKDPLGREVGEPLWPEWEDKVALARRRAQPSMTERQWESLYQQSPVVESGNIIKRDWIKIWNQKEPPKCDFILQSWDTAITAKNKSAFSVCLTFGVFKEDKTDMPSIILLSRWRGRVDYPDLRKMAQRLAVHYLDDDMLHPLEGRFTKRPPDMILIEAKATGEPLIADLWRAGITATRFNPNKHGDKDARLMLGTDIFENGRFWVPGQPPNYTMPRRWAEQYVHSLISFPATDSRDDADATSQAIIRLKASGWVKNSLDFHEELPFRVGSRPQGALYG